MDSKIEAFKESFNPAAHQACNIDCDICRECAQERPVCCQNMPCQLSPDDVKDLSFEGIIKLLDSGIVSVDWFHCGMEDTEYGSLSKEGEIAFFLRMKSKYGTTVHPAMGMTCCILWDKDKGCPLDYQYKPKGARELIPQRGGCNCIDGYPKDMCANDWMQYQDVLKKVVRYYEMKGDFTPLNPFLLLAEQVLSIKDILAIAYEPQ